MPTFTPGPLTHGPATGVILGRDEAGFVVGRHPLWTALCGVEADAVLYAASPDLFEACIAALGNARGWRAMMRRAVKAAKGGA